MGVAGFVAGRASSNQGGAPLGVGPNVAELLRATSADNIRTAGHRRVASRVRLDHKQRGSRLRPFRTRFSAQVHGDCASLLLNFPLFTTIRIDRLRNHPSAPILGGTRPHWRVHESMGNTVLNCDSRTILARTPGGLLH